MPFTIPEVWIRIKKPFEEVLSALKKVNKIAIVSCGSCAAMCQTGGTEGAKEMSEKLEQEGFTVTTAIISDEVCDNRVMIKDLRKIDAEVQDSDAILNLSCGNELNQSLRYCQENIP